VTHKSKCYDFRKKLQSNKGSKRIKKEKKRCFMIGNAFEQEARMKIMHFDVVDVVVVVCCEGPLRYRFA
jgi:hypothetical protein